MPGRISSSTLVGRREQLGALTEAYERTASGRSTVVVVGGEAGVGKTRVVAEFLERVSRHPAGATGRPRVLVGGCLELGQTVMPLAPLVGILRQLSQQLGPDRTAELYGAELACFLPDRGRPAAAAESAAGLFDALMSLLRRLDEQGPVVLVVEDMHWADRSTLDLVSYLAHYLGPARVMLLTTYRSDEMRRSHALRPVLAELGRLPNVRRLDLAPLTADEVVALLAAIRGAPPPPELAGQIVDRSEGNPFFAEELLAVAAEGGVPPTLRDILGARLDALPEQAKEVLRIAAAAGRRVDHRLLEQVATLSAPELEAGLRAAVEHEALVHDGDGFGYRFRHALFQEAVHEQLLPGERTRLHAAFADALSREPALAVDGPDGVHAELAYHALLAHDLDRAFASLVKAGFRARGMFAYAEAQQHFERAAELRPQAVADESADAPEVWELLRNAAHCARYAGDIRSAGAHLRRAITSLDPARHPVELGGLYGELSEALWLAGLGDAALTASDDSLRILPEDPTRERAEALAWRSRLLMLFGRYDEAIPLGREGVARARAVNAKVELCRALNSLGTSLCLIDQVDEGIADLRECIEVGRSVDAGPEVVRGYINLGSVLAIPLDRLDEAETYERAGLDYAVLFPASSAPVDWTRLELANVLLRLGRWDESEEVIHGVRLVGGGGTLAQYYHTTLAMHRVLRGRYQESAEHLKLAETETPDIRDPQALAPLVEGRLRLQIAGQGPDARRLPAEVDLTSCDPIVLTVYPLLARAEVEAALAGEPDAASRVQALVAQLRHSREQVAPDGPRAANLDYWTAYVEAEQSRLTSTDSELWARALAGMRRRGHADHELYTQYRLAEALAARGDVDRAGAELGEAHERAARLGAVPLVEQIEGLARRARLKLPGLPLPTASGGLTARELEVLALVVKGLTNREIGQALFISEKTASVHISNLLTKLGVANRTEAAHVARERALVGDG
jgi:DNA-binding CsgD family transcriptional regulator/tetratricopeptide (TPR) repeat protein